MIAISISIMTSSNAQSRVKACSERASKVEAHKANDAFEKCMRHESVGHKKSATKEDREKPESDKIRTRAIRKKKPVRQTKPAPLKRKVKYRETGRNRD